MFEHNKLVQTWWIFLVMCAIAELIASLHFLFNLHVSCRKLFLFLSLFRGLFFLFIAEMHWLIIGNWSVLPKKFPHSYHIHVGKWLSSFGTVQSCCVRFAFAFFRIVSLSISLFFFLLLLLFIPVHLCSLIGDQLLTFFGVRKALQSVSAYLVQIFLHSTLITFIVIFMGCLFNQVICAYDEHQTCARLII